MHKCTSCGGSGNVAISVVATGDSPKTAMVMTCDKCAGLGFVGVITPGDLQEFRNELGKVVSELEDTRRRLSKMIRRFEAMAILLLPTNLDGLDGE